MISFTQPVSVIPGVEPSADIRESLRGQTALLAFSTGKDAWASALAMRDAGIRVQPYYMHLIPDPEQPYTLLPDGTRKFDRLRGLSFVEENLAYCEDWFLREFGTRILRLINPSFYRWLAHYTYQPPERCAVIDACDFIVPGYPEMVDIARDYLGLPADTWVCDGVRAADSPMRRIAMASHGPRNFTQHKIHIVWDWKKYHVMESIRQGGITLGVDYELFNRSFDGIDKRFVLPLRDRFPDDYARILGWFPLVELQVMTEHLSTPTAPYPKVNA